MSEVYTEQWTDDIHFSVVCTTKLYEEVSPFQKIEFYDSKTLGRFFTLDGLMMVNEKDEFIYHDMITHPAFMIRPEIKNVLIIGGGDGGTAREVARYQSVERIDMVEIDERVVRLSQELLPKTAHALESDQRIHLYFEDGCQFVENTKDATYDLILVDSTDPISIGEGLFTLEFYKHCFRILNEKGILINQHETPYFSSYAEEMKKAHQKIKTIFPVSEVYQFHMPTYPSGHWLFGFASKGLHPIKDMNEEQWKQYNLNTRYYNPEIHKGSFMLPTYVKEALSDE